MKFADMFHNGGVFRGKGLEPGEVPAILSRETYWPKDLPMCKPMARAKFKRESINPITSYIVNVEYRPIKTPTTPEYIEMLDNIERVEVSERKRIEARIKEVIQSKMRDILEKQVNDFLFGVRHRG